MEAQRLFNLEGKIALVTGGSRGIGLYIAEGLGEMGAKLVITARNSDELAEGKKHLNSLGIEAHAITCDVSKAGNIAPLVDEVLDRYGTLDILFNNAGSNCIAPAEEYPDDGWDTVMGVHIKAPFRLSREIGRRIMIPKQSGRIINVGSTTAIQGNGTGTPGGGHFIGYHAAKGALHSFTRGLAVEWGHWNIKVNCLCPGFISTKRTAAFQASVGAQAKSLTPLGRFGGCDDIKGVAVFLASDASSFVTGQTIVVDGGLSIV